MRVKTIASIAQSALWGWWKDNCMRLSASLAFYTALSLAPLVIIVVGVAGLITERQQVAAQLEQQIGSLMGLASRQVVHTILATTEPQGGTLAAMIGIVTLAIGATAVFGEHWDGFKRVHPRYHMRYYDSLVDKMLRCGDPEQIGFIEYRWEA